jgi:hypothetical protein
MAFEAITLLQFIMIATWTCLLETPNKNKNSLFVRFFQSREDVENILSTLSMSFAPGLFEVLVCTTPPLFDFFKTLPTPTTKCWAVYAISLEKDDSRPRLYVGVATEHSSGVYHRFKQYDLGCQVPAYVQAALDEGYIVVHKGLLCWVPIPTAGSVPMTRLVFYALEATFAFMFWALYGDKTQHMSHLCLWDNTELEYDGCCSHSSLQDPIRGNFDLSADELEAIHAERKRLDRQRHAVISRNWHYKQMETNYADYMDRAVERTRRSMAKHPDRANANRILRKQKALNEETYACKRCNVNLKDAESWRHHLQTAKHRGQKYTEADRTFKCKPCKKSYPTKTGLTSHKLSRGHVELHGGTYTVDKSVLCKPCNKRFSNPGNLRTHEKNDSHKERVRAAAQSSLELD